YTTALLEREPEALRLLGQDLTPLSAKALTDEMVARAARRRTTTTVEEAIRHIRAIRRRELFRISAAELLGEADIDTIGAALSRLTDATLEASLRTVVAEEVSRRSLEEAPTRIAIIAMGRYGGFELSYASDADV